jgi:putative ATPase
VGLPEGQFHLTQAALYLATAKKSNTTLGFFDAAKAVEEEQTADVPSHLRDANRDKEGFGHGEGYLYPHAYRDHWVAQAYLPKPLQGRVFYKPSDQGYEATIRDDVGRRRELQLSAMMGEEPEEVLTFSPNDQRREQWIRRAESGRTEMLGLIRETLFAGLSIPRHAVILTAENGPGLLLWEAFRRTPEGQTVGLITSRESRKIVEHYAAELPDVERPIVLDESLGGFTNPQDLAFEAVIAHNPVTRIDDKVSVLRNAFDPLRPQGVLAFSQVIPSRTMRLSSLIEPRGDEEELVGRIRAAEETLYTDSASVLFGWDAPDLEEYLRAAGFESVTVEEREVAQHRPIRRADITSWVSATHPGSYGGALRSTLDADELERAAVILRRHVGDQVVEWKTVIAFVRAIRGGD